MSFPKMLDNASVLYYTPENCYGEVYYTTVNLQRIFVILQFVNI